MALVFDGFFERELWNVLESMRPVTPKAWWSLAKDPGSMNATTLSWTIMNYLMSFIYPVSILHARKIKSKAHRDLHLPRTSRKSHVSDYDRCFKFSPATGELYEWIAPPQRASFPWLQKMNKEEGSSPLFILIFFHLSSWDATLC